MSAGWPWCQAEDPPSPGPSWHYQLLPDTILLDDCLFCGRPTLLLPMGGSFTLTQTHQDPLFTYYALQDIHWTNRHAYLNEVIVTGTGTWRVGGEVALLQELVLHLQINGQDRTLTNTSPILARPFPMLGPDLVQTNDTPLQFYSLWLRAAPLRDFWFSTGSGFTGADGRIGTGGDWLSWEGRFVRKGFDLVHDFGFMPPIPPVQTDAMDVVGGARIVFSLAEDYFSESLGLLLHEGDLLITPPSEVYRTQSDLLKNFDLPAATPDLGLDAVQVMGQTVLFSTRTDVMTGDLKTRLGRGDILSSDGTVYRSHRDLLARFHPQEAEDRGLDAVHVWPHGEIWFSLEQGFQDTQLGPVNQGDVLSDFGYVVVRNLDLLQAFAPTEDLSDFGLDGLFVISDTDLGTAPPEIKSLRLTKATGDAEVTLSGRGRVFQLWKALQVEDPFAPASPIEPSLQLSDPGALQEGSSGYYLIRQW